MIHVCAENTDRLGAAKVDEPMVLNFKYHVHWQTYTEMSKFHASLSTGLEPARETGISKDIEVPS